MRQTPDFSAIYERFFHEVSRWARALGGLEADLDDLTQDVFLVARRQLASFDGENLAGWLYRITAHTVSDYRRRAWFRHLVGRGREALADVEETGEAPDELLERKEARRLVERSLRRMSARRREVFVLFEIEGYSGAEIAALLGIPEATVFTRIYHARKQFIELYARSKEAQR